MFQLRGHSALVTGGTHGIGAAIAGSLAQAGANLLLVGLAEDENARQTLAYCRSFGIEANVVYMDLSHETGSTVARLLQHVKERLPSMDLLVNNVGVYAEPGFLEVDFATYQRTMRINVDLGFFLTQAVARDWVQHQVGGRVLFTGSINGLLAEPQHAAYDTSKGAVASMVRTLCVELAPRGIRVNAIAPGLIRTPLTEPAIQNPVTQRWIEQHTPNGSIPNPDSCGPAAVFLLSDEAHHIHGQTLYIDGGMSIWQYPNPPA